MSKTTIERVQEYRNHPSISQSELKNILSNNTKPFKGSVAVLLGNLCDAMLTAPDTLDELYHITRGETYPKPQVKECWDKYYQWCIENEQTLEIDNGVLLEIYRTITSMKSGDEKLLANLMEAEAYWNELVEASGKVVISGEYWNKCQAVANTLLTNRETSQFFIEEAHREIHFQKELYWTYVDEEWEQECKGLLDALIIDHKDKTLQIVDLKTTSDSLQTWKNNIARRHRLEFQQSFYQYGLTKWHETNYVDYEILNPILVVANIDWPSKPKIFRLTNNDLWIGRYGLDKVKTMLIYDRDDTGYPTRVEWEENRIQGWEEAIRIKKQAEQLGLDDWDVEYSITKGWEELNLWL